MKYTKFKGDPSRLACFIFFFLLAIIFIIYIVLNHSIFFYTEPINGFGNWPRWIYALVSTFFGFSLVVYLSSRNHQKERILPIIFTYITKYFLCVLILGTIIYVIFSAINSTAGYLYYFIAAAIGVSTGYVIDFAADIHTTLNNYLKQND